MTTTALVNFFDAVKANEIGKVVELLKSKAVNVGLRDPTSHDGTALHIAADRGYDDLAKILVDEFNAPVNLQDKHHRNPLQVATDVHNINILKFLLKRNSDCKEYAQRYLNDETVDELFEAAEANDIEKIVTLVRDKKIDVNTVDRSNNNRTLLHVAATNGYQDLARVLVDEFHANIQREDDFGDTAKHAALDNEHPEIAEFLIERGYKDSNYTCLPDDDGTFFFNK